MVTFLSLLFKHSFNKVTSYTILMFLCTIPYNTVTWRWLHEPRWKSKLGLGHGNTLRKYSRLNRVIQDNSIITGKNTDLWPPKCIWGWKLFTESYWSHLSLITFRCNFLDMERYFWSSYSIEKISFKLCVALDKNVVNNKR